MMKRIFPILMLLMFLGVSVVQADGHRGYYGEAYLRATIDTIAQTQNIILNDIAIRNGGYPMAPQPYPIVVDRYIIPQYEPNGGYYQREYYRGGYHEGRQYHRQYHGTYYHPSYRREER